MTPIGRNRVHIRCVGRLISSKIRIEFEKPLCSPLRVMTTATMSHNARFYVFFHHSGVVSTVDVDLGLFVQRGLLPKGFNRLDVSVRFGQFETI